MKLMILAILGTLWINQLPAREIQVVDEKNKNEFVKIVIDDENQLVSFFRCKKDNAQCSIFGSSHSFSELEKRRDYLEEKADGSKFNSILKDSGIIMLGTALASVVVFKKINPSEAIYLNSVVLFMAYVGTPLVVLNAVYEIVFNGVYALRDATSQVDLDADKIVLDGMTIKDFSQALSRALIIDIE